MERVFKIKTKSNRDPRAQYPSERRYSASIVIGLSVVYLQLCFYSILMGSLIVHKLNMPDYVLIDNDFTTGNNTNEEMSRQLYEKVKRDVETEERYIMKMPELICAGCFLMSLGFFCAFITGIFAWKQWYIDHNITFFFFANSISMITSTLSFTISLIIFINTNFETENYDTIFKTQLYPITLSLALNIFILSFIGVIWSILASKVSYKGMKRNYPDDMNFSVGGRHVEVHIVQKGNKNCNVYPPDIISHFPATDKLAKYLPKKETSNLPKAESNSEYEQRVNKFLSGEATTSANQIS